MTEMEAWNLVVKAASNGFYGAKEEFAKLPRDVQEIVGSPAQLREWSQMDSDEFNTVLASNFQRSYRARAESRKVYGRLPENLLIHLPEEKPQALSNPEPARLEEPQYEYTDMPQSFREIAQKALGLKV